MRLTQRWAWFLAFTAAFAVLVGFVFWGTWSLDFVPVMPDHPTTHSPDRLVGFFNRLLSTGKFIPGDMVDLVGSPYFWQELKYALALYCAALGLAYFCRGRGLPRVASYGAGLLLAFCGYWMTLFSAGHYGWFQWMTYGVFAFGLIDRAVCGGKPRHWLLLGTVVAWASFNQQDLWLLFTLFTAAYFVFRCLSERKLPWRGASLALAAFALVGLPSFRDVLQNTLKGREETLKEVAAAQGKGDGKKDDKASRWEFVTNWSMPPEDTAEFLFPGVHGDTSCPFVLSIGSRRGSGVTPYTGRLGRPMNAPSGNYRQHSLYVGWALLLFAALGLAFSFTPSAWANGRSCATVWFFAVAAALFYLLSLGRFCELPYRVVFALPVGDMIRCPVKWHHLTELCLAVLAAHGIGSLADCLSRFGRYAPYAVGGLVLLGALDLARVDRRYCAPVDVTEARRTHSQANLTFLPRQQFQNPQVAEMVRQRRIVSVANYYGSPDVFLVEVLQPFAKEKPGEANVLAILLGLVSVLSSLGVSLFAARSAVADRRKAACPH